MIETDICIKNSREEELIKSRMLDALMEFSCCQLSDRDGIEASEKLSSKLWSDWHGIQKFDMGAVEVESEFRRVLYVLYDACFEDMCHNSHFELYLATVKVMRAMGFKERLNRGAAYLLIMAGDLESLAGCALDGSPAAVVGENSQRLACFLARNLFNAFRETNRMMPLQGCGESGALENARGLRQHLDQMISELERGKPLNEKAVRERFERMYRMLMTLNIDACRRIHMEENS